MRWRASLEKEIEEVNGAGAKLFALPEEMVRKRKSLSEELANLADPAPTGDFDPEDLDFRTGNAADEVAARDDSDDDDELRPIEVGRSALRMANAMSEAVKKSKWQRCLCSPSSLPVFFNSLVRSSFK